MMYYIDRPSTWKAENRKCAEIQDFVRRYQNCLIADDLSRNALVEEIKSKVEELNSAYPRTKRHEVHIGPMDDKIYCGREDGNFEYYVFIISILPVKKTYRFAENAAALEEGGKS